MQCKQLQNLAGKISIQWVVKFEHSLAIWPVDKNVLSTEIYH